jgi:hypothetical protein
MDEKDGKNPVDSSALLRSTEKLGCNPKWRKKPYQVKRERKTYAPTFKLVITSTAGPVAIQAAFPLALLFQKTEPPSGLPRRYASRNDEIGGECTGFPSRRIAPISWRSMASGGSGELRYHA